MRSHSKETYTTLESNGITLSDLARAPYERGRIVLFILLLTFNAGWIDILAYLILGHVFASFLTGNILFVGLALAQGDQGWLISAITVIVLSFLAISLGTFLIERTPPRQTERAWHITLICPLLIEWLLLLAFAIVWHLRESALGQSEVQILLLALAALGMGIQGAVVEVFNYPGVVANALTGTVLVLGQRLAHDLLYPGSERGKWKWRNMYRVVMLLTYVVGALIVASISVFRPVVPLIIVTIAILVVLAPPRRNMRKIPTASPPHPSRYAT
jgi:uncharacterized membrane protein YoaK (UPF0700 family)